MENELVRYSRAGDIFHYRWAARRCLKLISTKSQLRYIVIEGSQEKDMAGEYVIDVAEYSDSLNGDSLDIAYYQLKHTTVQKDVPFNLSHLKGTFKGFSDRFRENLKNNRETPSYSQITFTIVTNRAINNNLKENVVDLVNDGVANSQYTKTLEKYTRMSGEDLRAFCSCLRFADGEGDYNAQKHQLHAEISQLIAGTVDSPEIENVTALVRDKALPHSNGCIVREEILKYFGVNSERDLYPAPPEFEKLDNVIHRLQHETLLNCIINARNPVIIHAPGGVGKTTFALQTVESLPIGSIGVVYDCFGGGRYRNQSELRHRHRDALVQIANELASQGLCDPLLIQSNASEDDILRKFLNRIETTVTFLKKTNKNAILVILIDAADNAEMAAIEFNQNCFVHDLLRERVAEGVRIVALCRTERVNLLQPNSTLKQFELKSFSVDESFNYLLSRYSQAIDVDGIEFHRLTSGNPRVQANALSLQDCTIDEMFSSLIAIGTTVDEQIKSQLNSAVSAIKDKFPLNYKKHIDSICTGLATLPPFIPLRVLSRAAEIDESTIKSFVADLGRPLWLSDTSVQFRDEPTETWFRETYAASNEQIQLYIECLKPLANEYPYVASAMPSLLLQAGKYSELVELALSNDFLPNNNPIDERNVRVYRLQFAFKASLNLKNYSDAIKLALSAGEEVAGDKRQLQLLKNNIDLIAPLQNQERVQEFAFRRAFSAAWRGSENVYSAALLSTVKHFRGEARSYLRAAHNWLDIYFKDQDERKEDEHYFNDEKLKDEEIVELVYTHLNLHGAKKAVDYLLSWRPGEVVYSVSRKFFKRLVDAGDLSVVTEIASLGVRSQYLIIAFAQEFLEVGHIPGVDIIRTSLDLLTTSRARIPKPQDSYGDTTLLSLVSFLESCAARKLPKQKILRVLKHYYPNVAPRSISSNFQSKDREVYLRAITLKNVLLNNTDINIDELLPEDILKSKKYNDDQKVQEFKEVLGSLIPWYLVRIRSILGDITNLNNAVEDAEKHSNAILSKRWRDHDSIPYEVAEICSEILIFYRFDEGIEARSYYENHVHEGKLFIPIRLKLVRSAFRLNHLTEIKRDLEEHAYEVIRSATDIGPESRADLYIDLARSVINSNCDDAAIYFNFAIDAVSKFGDEIVERWEAVVSLANRRLEGEHAPCNLAYRFMRCAELIGDNVEREKYWDRDQAVRSCVNLSPVTALALLSRWRDREVGRFGNQLYTLVVETVSRGYLSPLVGWSLSAFLMETQLASFALLCIEKEQSHNQRQYILDSVIRELRINGVEGECWERINEITSQYSLQNKQLEEVIAFNRSNNNESKNKEIQETTTSINPEREEEKVNWNQLLNGLELTSNDGIRQALQCYDSIPHMNRNRENFWKEVYSRILDNDAVKFLYELIETVNADIFDIQSALLQIPKNWLNKVSIKSEWPKIMESVGRRFATKLVERGMMIFFTDRFRENASIIPHIQKGVIEGLSNHGDLVDSDTFFGFVKIAAERISTNEATHLLDFAISRFELHIVEEFADGPWSNLLLPPENINKAFAGFVWSALGSPRDSTRWRAAHCVRRLADAQCIAEIDALIEWMEHDSIDAFGSSKFPFYNLHARLFLLIALARISINNPKILLRHYNVFCQCAQTSSPHVLIRKYASDIVLNIENAFPDTYAKETVEQLKKVCISPMPILEMNNSWETSDSYWHAKGEINSDIEFLHGYDFSSYWFRPLGKVFGISGEQVEELATEVVVNEWNITHGGGYQNDPRLLLWSSSRDEQNTYHSHGSYPRIDNYNFYLSLHSMFVVAAKLLEKMPVVHSRDWSENDWEDWLYRHLLTRSDGFWLYDRRDPLPLIRRDWIFETNSSSWRNDIDTDDFLEGIFVEKGGETCINVFGSWEDGNTDRSEHFYITSSLVSSGTSQALLNALSTCTNPSDFKLPEYEEDEMEISEYPFILQGWVSQEEVYKRLDESDPHSSKLYYPPYEIGESIAEKMMLSVDYEKRVWFLPKEDKASVTCELWGEMHDNQEDPIRYGNRLTASIPFLKRLCLEFQSDLIIEVQIDRRIREKSYLRSDESNEYKPPRSKVFILTADGGIRDTETYYELRQSTSQTT